jgi:hypothetical protein
MLGMIGSRRIEEHAPKGGSMAACHQAQDSFAGTCAVLSGPVFPVAWTSIARCAERVVI